MIRFSLCLLFLIPATLHAQELEADTILTQAVSAAGGDSWLTVDSLHYDGSIQYFTRLNWAPRTTARYRMWREFSRDSITLTPTSGRVHINIANDEGTIFDGGNDFADDPFDENDPDDDNRWRNAFAIELLRVAHLDERYQIYRLPDVEIGGVPTYVLRILNLRGHETIINIDQSNFMLRATGNQDAMAWRQRIYDDFRPIGENGYMQPFSIKLYVNGALSASVALDSAEINQAFDESIFGHDAESDN